MRNQQELPYLFLQGIVSFNQKLSSMLRRWATSCIGEALAAARACRELSTAISYLISKQTDNLQCLGRINDCARQVFSAHLHCPAQQLVKVLVIGRVRHSQAGTDTVWRSKCAPNFAEVLEKVLLDSAAIKRLIEPEEVADLTAYLCSAGAGAITGAALTMDLGWTAR